jgi:hypothetical protein
VCVCFLLNCRFLSMHSLFSLLLHVGIFPADELYMSEFAVRLTDCRVAIFPAIFSDDFVRTQA